MTNTLRNFIRRIVKSDIDNIDNIIELISKYYNIPDIQKHQQVLINSQRYFEDKKVGAWGETSIVQEYSAMAPLATSEALLSLLPHYNDLIKNTIDNALNYLILNQNDDGGWEDLTTGISVVDATGCAVAALSTAHILGVINAKESVVNGVNFILTNQNTSGGWCAAADGTCKMHYTYFALLGLIKSKEFLSEMEDEIKASIYKSIAWINANSFQHKNEGLGLSYKDPLSPVATSLAIICFYHAGKKNEIEESWIGYLLSSQKNGDWEPETDEDIFSGQRRVYTFKTIPWAIQALILYGHKLNSEHIQNSLLHLKNYELSDGGYVKDIGDESVLVWFTSMILMMIDTINEEIKTRSNVYLDTLKVDVFNNREKIKKLEENKKLENRIIIGYFILLYVTYCLCSYTYYDDVVGMMGDLIAKIVLFFGFGVVISPLIYWSYLKDKLNPFWELVITVFLLGIYIFILQ